MTNNIKPSPVRVGLIGAGYWGKNYIRTLMSLPEADLRWVCDADPAARKRALQIAPQIRIIDELSVALSDKDAQTSVDAVVIATPAVEHSAHTIAALRAGKHVLVEKPMATSVTDAEAMCLASQQNGRLLMVGHLMLYHPAVERLQQMLHNGDLGDLYYLYALRVNLGQIRRDENALWSFGPHDLSMIQNLVACPAKDIAVRGESYLRAGVEDVVFVNITFTDKTLAQVQLSWLDPRKERRLTVVGSKKMVVFDDTHASEKLHIFDKGVDRRPEYESYSEFLTLREGDIHIPRLAMTEPLVAECRHFLHCIATGTPCRTSAESGLTIVRWLQAGQQSLRANGTPVTLAG